MKFKTFEQIILEANVPNHYHPVMLEPGVIQLPFHVTSTFKKLYRPQGTTKNTGNGEVALFWLFCKAYGGAYDVDRPPGNESADLTVGGVPVEVKGWDQDLTNGKRIKIGRFEKLHDLRRIINIVFGAYNVFYAGRYSGERYGKESYLSECSFGMNGLARAFDCALKIRDIELDAINNVRDVLAHPMYDGLEDPVDFATKTFAVLATRKLKKKIGSNSFIINARPDIMGRLEILQLGDLENVDFDMIKNEGARVQCSELFLNLSAFGKKV